MMDLSTIRAMNKSAANRARRSAVKPFIPAPAERAALNAGNIFGKIRIPMLGDYVPRGWEKTDDAPLFCDKSSCGLESEPALTLRALAETIKNDPVDIGYASHDEGQFQIYVSRYRRKVAKARKVA